MKKIKFLLCLLLAFCLVLGTVPQTAVAAGGRDVPAAEVLAEEAEEEIARAIEELAGDASDLGDLLSKIANSDLLKKILEKFGGSEGIRGILEKIGQSKFLQNLLEKLGNSKLVSSLLEKLGVSGGLEQIIELIKSLIGGGGSDGIKSVGLIVNKPDPGTPYAPSSLISNYEDNEFTIERVVYVKDGVESEEPRIFTRMETFQVRVTLKAKDDKTFSKTLWSLYAMDSENITVEKNDGGTELILLMDIMANKQKGAIASATLTVEGPLGGQSSAEFEPIVSLPAEDSYVSYEASWCDASGNFLEDEVIFEAGQTYYMNVGLSAIEGAWFVQGQEGTTLIVHGGNKASDLVIENETEEDGTIYSNANAIVAVKATAAVDGLIQKLSLDFTKPEPGTKVSQAKDGAPTPALDLRIPEGVSYSFVWPEAARYAEGWGNPTTFNNFVLEDGVGLNAITILKTDAPNSFYAHALVSIEDAEVKNVELLDSTTLKVTFAFQVGGEPRDTVSVLLCDTEQNLNTGGTVKALCYGAGEEPDLENAEENDICFERSGMPGGILRLEAVPKEGYDFAGWFTGYADRPWSDEGACYDPDSLISAETVISYDFKETGMNCYCAVFKLSGTPEEVHAKKVSLSKSSAKVLVGKTLKLKATVTPAKAVDGAITWKSGNTKIATVSRDGLVTAKAPGTVTIRAMTANGVKATCKVTVTFRYVYECEKNGYYRYTTNKTIVKELRNQGWSYRKAFRAPGVSDTKVYWIYNKTTKRYRYTTNLTYAKQQKAAGNKAGFAFYQAASKTVPVYELAKGTKTVTYYYTMKRATAREMQKQGWRYEGIAWYAQPKTA